MIVDFAVSPFTLHAPRGQFRVFVVVLIVALAALEVEAGWGQWSVTTLEKLVGGRVGMERSDITGVRILMERVGK